MAAPMATTSSGLTPLFGSLSKMRLTSACTAGMRVIPPTSTTSSICACLTPASSSARSTGPRDFSMRSSVSCSSLARVSVTVRCFGPLASAVMKGRLISVCMDEESSFLAFSAASFRRWSAILSERRSMPWSRLNSSASQLMMRWSKSSPPRCVSPLVAFTSKTPSPSSRIEISKVPAAQVIDGDALILLLIQAIRQRGCRWFVDDTLDIQSGDLACVASGLALRVVEIRRHRNDGLGNALAQVCLGVSLQLLQDHRADFRRRILLDASFHPGVAVGRAHHLEGHEPPVAVHLGIVVFAPHKALDRENSVLGVGNRLALRHLSNQPFAVLGEGDDRWCGACALGIGDDHWLATFHHGDAAIGCAQVNADHFAHEGNPPHNCS